MANIAHSRRLQRHGIEFRQPDREAGPFALHNAEGRIHRCRRHGRRICRLLNTPDAASQPDIVVQRQFYRIFLRRIVRRIISGLYRSLLSGTTGHYKGTACVHQEQRERHN